MLRMLNISASFLPDAPLSIGESASVRTERNQKSALNPSKSKGESLLPRRDVLLSGYLNTSRAQLAETT